MMITMILYDTLADGACHLNSPLGRGMESMIVSRTKVDHCLKNDDVDGEYDMIMVIMCRLRILVMMIGDPVEASCPASECWWGSA